MNKGTRTYTLYDVLGVEPDAPAEKIKAIYYLRSREVYPYRPGVGDEELQKQLNEAYQALKNPEKRRAYNEVMKLPLTPRPLKPGKPIYIEVRVNQETSPDTPIPLTFSRWEPCRRCWGEGCTFCQQKGKQRETVALTLKIPHKAQQLLVEGQGAVSEPGGNRGDLIVYVVLE